MDVQQLAPDLYFLRYPVGHAYLYDGPGGLALFDTGLPGSADSIAAAIRQAGRQPADLRWVLLTHFHPDHAGSAAAVAGWGGAQVLAHGADAPFVRGTATGPPPDLAGWEKPIYEQVSQQLPASATGPEPGRVDRELAGGEELAVGGGAVAMAAPGHTPGSVAFYLPGPKALITGDAIGRGPDGTIVRGVFSSDRQQAAATARQLATLDTEIACFGHGEPLTRGAAGQLQAALEGATDD
jgi:glyoxylase-like metal-dependent hydrolase (beta-lactamase superfamily II)